MATAQPESAAAFRLKFWGVRGSLPTTTARNGGVGGNTPCMQVILPSPEILIFDAGTGIRALGREILNQEIHAQIQPPKAIHIFLTHFHWDHIQGLPYFAPLFVPGSKVVFHSAHPPDRLESILAAQMRSPYFPIELDKIEASVEFRQSTAQLDTFGDLSVSSFPLHHPQGSVGYRIAHRDRTAIYATDHEHGHPETDAGLRNASLGADVLVYDAQYLPSEYEAHRGWGHSTWREGANIARHAGVNQLALFHHDPDRDDDAVAGMAAAARAEFAGAIAAQESIVL